MSTAWRGLARGAAAGAAGTTALNATTYLDIALRARPASDVPQQMVNALAEAAGLQVPGSGRERARRLSALGPLAGIATGVALGSVAGVLWSAGLRLPTVVGGPLLGLAAMAAADGPIAALHISDPRSWSVTDWVSDVVPHLMYGFTTHATLVAVSRAAEGREVVSRSSLATILRAAALGAATGSRCTAGVTAIALTSAPDEPGVLASKLGTTAGKVVTTTAAAAEVAADKMPTTPSRLAAPGLVLRLTLGPIAAAAMAQREKADGVLPALVGLVCAAVSSFVWARLRAVAARRFGSDLPAAFVEDAVTVLLDWLGTRRAPKDAVTTAEPMAH